jgi:hypothetical protein
MMLLQWRLNNPALQLQWRGPDGGLAPLVAANPPMPVPTLIGPPGAPGSQGPTGPAGPQGPQGLDGAIGPVGPAGPVGPIGPTGATGPQGAIGLTGPSGAGGAVGPVGPQGPTGATGPQGPTGPAGPSGPSGLSGTATITLPAGPGAYEWNETVTAIGVTPSDRLIVMLAPDVEGDENDTEFLSSGSLCASAGTDQITVTASFSSPEAGPIKLYWKVL